MASLTSRLLRQTSSHSHSRAHTALDNHHNQLVLPEAATSVASFPLFIRLPLTLRWMERAGVGEGKSREGRSPYCLDRPSY